MSKTFWELLAEWHQAEAASREERSAEREPQYRSAYGDWPKREAASEALNALYDFIAINKSEGSSAMAYTCLALGNGT